MGKSSAEPGGLSCNRCKPSERPVPDACLQSWLLSWAESGWSLLKVLFVITEGESDTFISPFV